MVDATPGQGPSSGPWARPDLDEFREMRGAGLASDPAAFATGETDWHEASEQAVLRLLASSGTPAGVILGAFDRGLTSSRRRRLLLPMLEQARPQRDVMPAQFGSQIRNYVMQPYTLVKDVSTGVEVGNVQAVLEGELELLIEGWLRWRLDRR